MKLEVDIDKYIARAVSNSMEIEGFHLDDELLKAAVKKGKRLFESGEVERRFERARMRRSSHSSLDKAA